MTPEKQVQNSILAYLNGLKKLGEPIFVERRQAGGFNYKKGLPDVYCVYYGRHIEIEVKAIGGHQSPMQIKFEQMFKAIGCAYVCAQSVEEVKQLLENIAAEEQNKLKS